jgi:diaminopimelate decarboxylase
LLAEVIDIASTNKEAGGHDFIKLNTGLNEVTRPALYGAQHSIRFFTQTDTSEPFDTKPFVVVGHCCESGDLLTCDPNDSNELREIQVPSTLQIGDYALIKGTGAYCSAMSLKNYNSFPEAAEVLITAKDEVKVIRRRQNFDEIMKNEIDIFNL